ncbi:ABC transporter permease [Rhodococcus spongiicola]|uniref:ABC transporter permease n=1 Tax=Rhodococcus spongiicola TaxID=2487352 RepID=A0A3S3DY75_9NOCA|nr:ABC transporter permease subunit [Rhodococcus spongiicola]RVW00959.1 ABC transporter permease [Rhodococcus spongiicola]
MTAGLVRLDLLLRRRSLVGYSLGIGVYAFVIVALYPAFRNETGLDQFTSENATLAALFGITEPLSSSSGWLNANLYANFLPLIVLLITIGYGAGCIAGQNEEGTLGLVVTLPLTRNRIALQKVVAMCLVAVPVSAVAAIVVFAGRGFDLQVDTGALIGVTIAVLLLGIGFGALALLIGALTGSRATALGITAMVAAAAYLVNSLAPVVSWIRPARLVSPFYYAVGNNQLIDGVSFSSFVVLIGIAVVLSCGAVIAFRRLDVD